LESKVETWRVDALAPSLAAIAEWFIREWNAEVG
jgi:hypothetical protein